MEEKKIFWVDYYKIDLLKKVMVTKITNVATNLYNEQNNIPKHGNSE